MENILDYRARDGLLTDRIILVSGATSGIGRALAVRCAGLGARVVLLGRNIPLLENVYDEIVEGGGSRPGIYPFNLETTEWAEYEKMTAVLESEYGQLDGLVNNAALLGELSPIEHYEPPVWFRVMQVNLNAQFLLTRSCLPLLRKSPDASVIFATSSVGNSGRAHWGAYAVSKFGVEGLAQILADECENTDVRVNLINPGATRTKMRREAYPMEDRDQLLTPEAVLPGYLFLLGPDSRGISGKRFDCQPKTATEDKT